MKRGSIFMKAILNLQIKIFLILILILVVSGLRKDIKVIEISKNIYWHLSSHSLADSPLIIVINKKEYNSDRIFSKEEKLEILAESINFTESLKGVKLSELPTKERHNMMRRFAHIKGRTVGKIIEKMPTESFMVGLVENYYIKRSTIYEKIIAYIIIIVFINFITILLTLLLKIKRSKMGLI